MDFPDYIHGVVPFKSLIGQNQKKSVENQHKNSE